MPFLSAISTPYRPGHLAPNSPDHDGATKDPWCYKIALQKVAVTCFHIINRLVYTKIITISESERIRKPIILTFSHLFL